MQKIERPKTLVELAVTEIRGQIVSGTLAPGERIAETSVGQALGISTTPVREAFQRLELAGLVTIVPRKGTYVFELSPNDLDQLCEARLAIEPVALRLAYECNRSLLIERLSEIIADMSKCLQSKRINDYLLLDTAFHAAVLDLCANVYLQKAYELVGWKASALRARLSADAELIAKSFAEHKQIRDHLKKQDLAAAIDVLPQHLSRGEGTYWRHLEEKWEALAK
jgi:DNA-binding GntR family transcriptional regulator